MIEVRSVSKSFGALPVLRSLSCNFQPGRITGLIGPNACGKTTLIKSILGLIRPDSGEIVVGGLSAAGVAYRQQIGYMPQQASFPANVTPEELFRLLATLRGGPGAKIAELSERFQINPFLRKAMGKLSAGTRQKISAVAAFGFSPSVLILDEPTAGFDPVSCVVFKELLHEVVGEGATIVIVSHILSELEQTIDDLVFLLDGQVRFSGDGNALRSQTGERGIEAGIVRLLTPKKVSAQVEEVVK